MEITTIFNLNSSTKTHCISFFHIYINLIKTSYVISEILKKMKKNPKFNKL